MTSDDFEAGVGMARRIARATGVIVLSAVLVTLSTACAMWGDGGMDHGEITEMSLDFQHRSAIHFRIECPGVEAIRFTQEGDYAGFGASWSANAVATVRGIDYRVIIGPSISASFIDGVPPEPPTPSAPTATTVVYSDGTSEVLQ